MELPVSHGKTLSWFKYTLYNTKLKNCSYLTALPLVWNIWSELLLTNYPSHVFYRRIRRHDIVVRQLVFLGDS